MDVQIIMDMIRVLNVYMLHVNIGMSHCCKHPTLR